MPWAVTEHSAPRSHRLARVRPIVPSLPARLDSVMNTPRAARPDKTENPQADEIAALRQRVAQLEAQLDAASQGPATRDSDAQARTLQSLEKTDRSRQVLLNILEDQKRTEDKLRASEQRLREAQRLAGIGSWVLDLTSRCLTWSDEMFNILDIDRADFSGGFPDFLSAIHPDDRERVDREYTASVAQRTPYDTIHRLRLKDGSIKHLHLCCHTHYAEDGSPLHSMGTVQDITERLLAEKQREALLQRLEEAQRIGNIGSWEWNLQTRQGTWSRELYRILGRDPVLDPPSFKVLLQHVHPDDLEDFEAQLHDSLETGVFEVEFRCLRHDDQSVRSLSARGKVEFDTDGKPLRHFGVAMDISRRKQTEEQLRKLAQAVEQSPESTVITNLDAEIEYVNEAFLRTTGFRRDEVLGQNPRILQSSSTPRQTYESLWASLTRGLPWQGEFHNKRKNGGEFIERALIVPVRNQQGTITHYVGVSQDITEHKRLDRELDAYRHRLEERVAERTAQLAEARQKAEAASGAKSAFLANMSHEIRTPMNGVLGMAGLLRGTTLTPEQESYTDAIQDSGRALVSLIDDILDLSKIEAGKMDLSIKPFDLVEILESTCELLAPRAHEKGLDIACYVDPHLAGKVVGDPARLRQVLLNLAGNAAKFTDEGSVTITAEADRGSSAVLITVSDTGIGMTPEDTDKVFHAFTQADSGHDRSYGGTGLGLAISQKLVKLMGGSLRVTSELGEGSSFSFSVNLPRADEESPKLERPLEGKTFVLAGLDEATRKCAASYIESWGGRVKWTNSAHALDAMIQLSKPECLVCGPELARTYEATGERPNQSLVVMPPSARKEIGDGADLGFSGYLVTPIRQATLKRELSSETGHSASAKKPSKAPKPAPDHVALNILLVEDNPLNAMLALKVLENAGHKTSRLSNGQEVVDKIQTGLAGQADELPDAILMDVQMPVLDGLMATRKIRELEADDDGQIPIVALTANAMPEDREACLEAGMNAYLAKPFDADDLSAVLQNVTGNN